MGIGINLGALANVAAGLKDIASKAADIIPGKTIKNVLAKIWKFITLPLPPSKDKEAAGKKDKDPDSIESLENDFKDLSGSAKALFLKKISGFEEAPLSDKIKSGDNSKLSLTNTKSEGGSGSSSEVEATKDTRESTAVSDVSQGGVATRKRATTADIVSAIRTPGNYDNDIGDNVADLLALQLQRPIHIVGLGGHSESHVAGAGFSGDPIKLHLSGSHYRQILEGEDLSVADDLVAGGDVKNLADGSFVKKLADGTVVRDFGGGGDCLFKCVAHAKDGNKELHGELRQQLADWIEANQHSEDLAPVLDIIKVAVDAAAAKAEAEAKAGV